MISHRASPPEGGTDEGVRPLHFLCTNDDGIDAPGLELLVQAAEKLGEVFVVAPDRQRSASSQSLTLRSPITKTEVSAGRLALSGTPTDCVLIAIEKLCGELYGRPPDFVLSGVNHGANMGEDVLYSGTVAAAIEGTILGVPSIALSFTGRDTERLAGYGDVLERLLRVLVTRDDFPEDTLLNINLPDLPSEEVVGSRVTVLDSRQYVGSVNHLDPAGRDEFWIGDGTPDWKGSAESDFSAVVAGYVSITPLHLDLTNFRLIERVRSWPLEL
ncbi:MAG: 5'/3'-nucleotidase SurE [Gemmatimonadales bacterium]